MSSHHNDKATFLERLIFNNRPVVIALCVLVALLAVPLLKLSRVLDEARLTVRDVGHNSVPILQELKGTVVATNEELAKLSLVTDDVSKASGHATVVTGYAAQMSTLFAATLGGPLGDRIGRKRVIWFSILGAAPFSLLVPYANLAGTVALTFLAGMILASAFSAIVVYAQELLPGRVGMVSGLIFGFAFGVGGMGAGLLGQLADHYGIETVYRLCAWLPVLGVCAVLLPDLRRSAAH